MTAYCPTCGSELDLQVSESCPNCQGTSGTTISAAAPTITPPGTSQATPPANGWGAGAGILVWFASVALIIGFQAIVVVAYFVVRYRQRGELPQNLESDPLVIVLSIAATFPAHVLTLLIAWLVVTARGQRPFLPTMGWSWHSQFKWIHAVGLALLMFGLALLFEQLLPHRETDLERILKLGASVRILVASLAVLTAPLVEEVVYRGVLYTGIERAWGRGAGIGLVTLLFALVHVPQYWGSYAAIMGILTLSLVLTWLRAATGKLLPCVATHLVYNGIQSFLVLAVPDNLLENSPTKAAIAIIWRSLGLG